jgi:hypothetical protein
MVIPVSPWADNSLFDLGEYWARVRICIRLNESLFESTFVECLQSPPSRGMRFAQVNCICCSRHYGLSHIHKHAGSTSPILVCKLAIVVVEGGGW